MINQTIDQRINQHSFNMSIFTKFSRRTENSTSKIDEQLEFINDKNWGEVVNFLDAKRRVKRWEKLELINELCSDRENFMALSQSINDDEKAKELFLKIAECGGKRFVLCNSSCRKNLLQIACRYNTSFDVVSKLIAIGGRAAVLEETSYGWNSLHVASRFNSSIDVVTKLIETGGPNLVLHRDSRGWNSLHYACRYNTSIEVVKKLIETGGKELVVAKAQGGVNALHLISFQDVSIDLLMKLIEVGGKELIRDKVEDGWNSLHVACGCNASIEVVTKLLEVGGSELLMEKDRYEKNPLHIVLTDRFSPSERNEVIKVAAILISEGLQSQVGGEYGIGGLFNSTTNEVQAKIYNKWDDIILPALDKVKADLDINMYPILQAAIINRSPSAIIKDIVKHLDCVDTKDKGGQLPIDAAIRFGRKWNDGTKEIAEALALVRGRTLVNTCTRHGLQWEDGLKCVLEEGGCKDIEERDIDTGLFPFMFAALNGTTESVFHLIKMSPHLLVNR